MLAVLLLLHVEGNFKNKQNTPKCIILFELIGNSENFRRIKRTDDRHEFKTFEFPLL